MPLPSDSDASSVSSNCAFSPFSMPCNFFFDRHEQRTVVNRLLVIWWGEGQREVFQGPMIRPECFNELWTVNFTSVSVFFCPLGWKRMAWVASGWVFPFSHLQGYSWLELSISQVILRWVVVQSVGCVWVYATPWTAAHQTYLFFTIFAQTHVHWVGDAIQPSHPLSPHFASCLQSFPASGSFPVSQLFTSGRQIIEASASVLPMNIQGSFPLGLTGLISLLFKGLSRVFSSTIQKPQFFGTQPS